MEWNDKGDQRDEVVLENIVPYPQSCINESREDINALTREEKKYFLKSCH